MLIDTQHCLQKFFKKCCLTIKLKRLGLKDILDLYIQHRLKMDAMNHSEGEYRDPKNQYPSELLCRFEMYFKNRSEEDQLSVREVKAEHIGKLITVNSMLFMPLTNCESEICRLQKSGGRLYLQTRGSKFIKFQEIKIQELNCKRNKTEDDELEDHELTQAEAEEILNYLK
ncbi:DNA replication licensing factor Mcm7 [Caerostris darwini]|uniref:DNA replication licensing factor Mcm7 n=1 Tax=Caerostris darwini TaxID=1538125 RepID=A0AAV4WP49_9ARAC|nr:DNA replication licensing factor Mcm7 [Caerostris darwini]